MTTKKKILVCVLWLVVPYLCVLLIAFILGVIIGMSDGTVTQPITNFIDGLVGVAILGGIVMAILAGFGQPRSLYEEEQF